MISQFGTAAVVNGEHTVYLTCKIGICTTDNDPFCEDVSAFLLFFSNFIKLKHVVTTDYQNLDKEFRKPFH